VTPRLTVLLVTHNDEAFVRAAIESVLAQTVRDVEVVIVDDASTDRSREVAASYRDPRIRLLANPTNRGAGASRNAGLAAIASEYVAELDGNDVAEPARLAQQLAYLETHPDVAVVGGQAVLIDVAGRRIGTFRRPTTDLGIRWCGIFQSPVIHSTVMYRRAIVRDELGGYDERFHFGEDFDLWCRLARTHVIRNLPHTLVAYRSDPGSLTGTSAHPAREGYPARKAVQILENLRDVLQEEDATRHAVDCWLALGDVDLVQRGDDVREAIAFVERCAARFASVCGEDEQVAAHQAEMLVRGLRKGRAAGRLFTLRLWMAIRRRHPRTAWRAWPRFATVWVFGAWPFNVWRIHRQRRARRWKARAAAARAAIK
jgi:glycosyltransferase involved in cell wall biosynthesis